jgi:hypothetical protein
MLPMDHTAPMPVCNATECAPLLRAAQRARMFVCSFKIHAVLAFYYGAPSCLAVLTIGFFSFEYPPALPTVARTHQPSAK